MDHSVPEQVPERLGQALQDHPVEFGVSATDHEIHFLARGLREVPDNARQWPRDHREGQGPHSDRGVLEVVEHALTRPERLGNVLRLPCWAAQ